MCEPTAIFMGLLSAAGTGMKIIEGNRTAQSLMDNAATTIGIENEARYNQETENNQSAALDKLEVQRAALRKIASATVSAGESGIGGNSVLREFMTNEIQASHDEGIVETSRSNANKQVRLNAKGGQAEYDSKISQAKGAAGSVLGNILSIGMAGVGGYMGAGGKFTKTTTTPTTIPVRKWDVY